MGPEDSQCYSYYEQLGQFNGEYGLNIEPDDEYINLSIHECISRLSPKSADKLAVQEMKNKNVEEFLKAQMVHRFN